MYKVYGDMLSGNCYKVKLCLRYLGIDHQWQHVDILNRETHTEEFLRMNPNGRIPLLEIDANTYLAESNAILHYLAEGSKLIPEDKLMRAQMLEWQFFEQYSHEPYIAVARYINKYLSLPTERQAEYHAKQDGGHHALRIMEQALAKRDYLVGNQATLADISLYAYSHVADEGGFDLSAYPKINAWFQRIEQLPGYVRMSRDNG